MPSEEREERISEGRTEVALRAVGTKVEAFRSAMAITADQFRGYLAGRRSTGGEEPSRVASELGAFAAGRIDSARFAQVLSVSDPPGEAWVPRVEAALAVLDELDALGEGLFRVRVERGGDLQGAVEQALAQAGRAFGAARVAELARAGRYSAADHGSLLQSFPFRRWSAAERELAPPLVVEVDGGDLLVGGLASYLDGSQKIVLVVEGEAPPAPLVRLASPGVLVLQTDDPEALSLVGETRGPAVAALLPSDAGRFVHQPASNGGPGSLEIEHLPEQEPRRALGSLSVFQQQEDLRMLGALAAQAADGAPAPDDVNGEGGTESTAAAATDTATEAAEGGAVDGAAPPPPAPAAPADPADRLAAWLLQQADLGDLGADRG